MSTIHISCAPGANIGETVSTRYLLDKLPRNSDGVLLTNFNHRTPNGTSEIDLLLINERGVWVLEVKHWSGYIEADQVDWRQGSLIHPSPLVSIENKAKKIAGAIRNAGISNVSVVGMVVMSHPEGKWDVIDDPNADHVFRLGPNLVKAVTAPDYVFMPHRNRPLNKDKIEAVKNALIKIKIDPQRQIVSNYRLMRKIETEVGDGYIAFEGQHTSIPTMRARVKRYRVPTNQLLGPEFKEAVRRFQQDIQALNHIESHPNIIRARDFMTDPDSNDTYWLLLEWVEGQTLRDRLTDKQPVGYAETLNIVKSVARALEFCHSKGILHRNLTPAAIFLTAEGGVKLGDFDFARVPSAGQTITVAGTPLVLNKFTAPEMQTDARLGDARADLYSLGVIWYEVLMRPPASEPILQTKLKNIELPPAAAELLKKLLATQPAQRPQTAREVVEQLENL